MLKGATGLAQVALTTGWKVATWTAQASVVGTNYVVERAVADPRALLASVQGMLSDDGRVLIRMPVTGGLAWRNYGENWVQLDAPRHLVLYTADGFRRIAEECGFLLDEVFYDSGTFQFWGSELVRSGEAHAGGPGDRFTSQQMAAWATEAERLNRALDGDQASFVLRSAQH